MSHYFHLKCSKCGDETESRNHGDTGLRELREVYPAARSHLKALDKLGFSFPTSCLSLFNESFPEGVLEFLLRHDGHAINIMSEYSCTPEEIFCEEDTLEEPEEVFEFLLVGQSPEDWFPQDIFPEDDSSW